MPVDGVDDTAFDRLGLLEVKSQASLQHVGELAAADRDVACKERTGALNDIYVHRRGTDIEQRYDIVSVGMIIDLVAVLQGERVDVDDDRRLARKLDRLTDIVDPLAFAGGDQNVCRLRTSRP